MQTTTLMSLLERVITGYSIKEGRLEITFKSAEMASFSSDKFLTCERFSEDLINAIKSNTMTSKILTVSFI